MSQLTLFDANPAPRDPPHSGAETSKAAAETVKPCAGKLRELVLWFIARRGPDGATDHELSAGLGMHPDTARARRVELRDTGDVCDSGKKRPAPSGCAATVWIATGRPLPAGNYFARNNRQHAGQASARTRGSRPPAGIVVCPHVHVDETPTFDGYVNRTCRDCGEELRCRKAEGPNSTSRPGTGG